LKCLGLPAPGVGIQTFISSVMLKAKGYLRWSSSIHGWNKYWMGQKG